MTTTAETPIGRNRDNTNSLNRSSDQERVLILWMSTRDMANHGRNSLRIGSSCEHLVLSTPHLARCHHFHCRGDLLSVFNTRDLGLYFFAARHCQILLVDAVGFEVFDGRCNLACDIIVVVASCVDGIE